MLRNGLTFTVVLTFLMPCMIGCSGGPSDGAAKTPSESMTPMKQVKTGKGAKNNNAMPQAKAVD